MHTCDGADQCTCNPDQLNPWWMVDLGADKQHTITQVKIYNRVDCCMNRLDSSQVQILNDQGTVVASRPIQGALPVYTFDFDNVIGRSVRIQKSQGVFSIAEVEVMGWSIRIPPYQYLLDDNGPVCPQGRDISTLEDCQEAGIQLGYGSVQSSSGWPHTPCGCFMWANSRGENLLHFDGGSSDCVSSDDRNRGMVCKTVPDPAPVVSIQSVPI